LSATAHHIQHALLTEGAADGEQATTFTANDINTSVKAVQQYVLDWGTLSQGGDGATVQIDWDGDRVFETSVRVSDELAQGDLDAAPKVSGVSPISGKQGETLDVMITGTGLTGTGIAFGDGITVNSFAVDSPTQITASISISAMAVPGARGM